MPSFSVCSTTASCRLNAACHVVCPLSTRYPRLLTCAALPNLNFLNSSPSQIILDHLSESSVQTVCIISLSRTALLSNAFPICACVLQATPQPNHVIVRYYWLQALAPAPTATAHASRARSFSGSDLSSPAAAATRHGSTYIKPRPSRQNLRPGS